MDNMNSMNSVREQRLYKKLTMTVLRDLVSTGSVGLILVYIYYFNTPFVRGFYCSDETIRYPWHESTIPTAQLYLVGTFTNIALILVLEYLNLTKYRDSAASDVGEPFDIRLYIKNIYCRLIILLFGAITSELLTCVSKNTAGRLRPHFIDVCDPVIGPENVPYDLYCRDNGSRYHDNYKYIIDYTCRGAPKRLKDIRMSFMSGHSSFAAYCAVFGVMYIQAVMKSANVGLIKPSLQVILMTAAFYTGLTRVSDYKHHWQDVTAGLALGSFVGYVTATLFWRPFHSVYARLFNENNSHVCDTALGEEMNRITY